MKYIAFYDTIEYKDENRAVAPSAANVVRYMADVMSEVEEIEIISPSRTLNKSGYYHQRKTRLNDRIVLIQPPSFGTKTAPGRYCSVFQVRMWLFFYLLFHLKRHESIVVYHSLSYMGIIRFLKAVKHLEVTEEIREIYADVKKPQKEKIRNKEMSFFSLADKYIFPTFLLNDLINTTKKPYVIATGIYKPEKKISSRADDGIVHVVYAGTLRPEKGGAAAAAAAAAYLPGNYHVHILGYGTDEAVKSLKAQIEEISSKGGAGLTYDGLLRGDEFLSFLQKCHIGLATQDSGAAFNDTSFPSKILTYLVNDLEVLTGKIRAVQESPVSRYLHYYERQTPESIAEAIRGIDVNNPSSARDFMVGLDISLRSEIKTLLHATEKK